MKRLIATLAAVFFSITASVSFVNPKTDNFVLNTSETKNYWSPGNSNNMTAGELFAMMHGGGIKEGEKCDTAQFVPSRLTDDGGGWYADTSTTPGPPYWFAVTYADSGCTGIGESCWVDSAKTYLNVCGAKDAVVSTSAMWKAEGLGLKHMGDEGATEKDCYFYICAPADGTIQTSHYACNYGGTMDFKFTYDGVDITMSIREARCWYCCRDKDVSDSGYYSANTQDNLMGKQLAAGALLVVGDADTTITFTRA